MVALGTSSIAMSWKFNGQLLDENILELPIVLWKTNCDEYIQAFDGDGINGDGVYNNNLLDNVR